MADQNLEKRTEQVRTFAYELGFDGCGFAKAGRLEPEERKLEEWLNQGRHSQLHWMEKNFDKRVDPTRLVPGAESVVSVIASYNTPETKKQIHESGKPKIAKYAQGRDYHKVFKKKLAHLFEYCRELVGSIEGRIFVDSAPVLDKAWAVRSGVGWLGKNTMVMNKENGSFFLIGEMILDARFKYNETTTDHCGTCTRCIDACPTDAIYEPYRVDADKCISNWNIEMKEELSGRSRGQMGEWMFGCDICQDVCPWNRKARHGHVEDLQPRRGIPDKSLEEWEELDEEEYERLFNGSAIRRAKFPKLRDNIDIAATNIRKGREYAVTPEKYLKKTPSSANKDENGK